MDKIATGRVRTTHGIHGYLKVQVFSGENENFLHHTYVMLRKGNSEKRYDIEDSKIQGGGVLMKLKGIDTPEAGKTLNGWEIWIPKEESSPLEDGEFYQADLYGCTIVYGSRTIGTVVSVIEGPQAELLEVKKVTDGVCYIPFMKEYIGTVDIDEKTIEILHEWIAE